VNEKFGVTIKFSRYSAKNGISLLQVPAR